MFRRVGKIINPLSSISMQMQQAHSEVFYFKNVIKTTWNYYKTKKAQLNQIKDYFSEENYLEAKKIYSLPSPFFDETVKIIEKEYLIKLLEEYKSFNDDEFSVQVFLYHNTKPYKSNRLKIDDSVIWDFITEIIILREAKNEIE